MAALVVAVVKRVMAVVLSRRDGKELAKKRCVCDGLRAPPPLSGPACCGSDSQYPTVCETLGGARAPRCYVRLV